MLKSLYGKENILNDNKGFNFFSKEFEYKNVYQND